MNAPIDGVGDYRLNGLREPLRDMPPIIAHGSGTERL